MLFCMNVIDTVESGIMVCSSKNDGQIVGHKVDIQWTYSEIQLGRNV